MAWVNAFHKRARFGTGQRILYHCFKSALLFVALVLGDASVVTANEAEKPKNDLTFNPDIRPFTSAEIRTVLRLMDQAKQRLNPEYYLSEEYLNETNISSQILQRQKLRQQKWQEAAVHRREVRDQHVAEQEANRNRIRKLREQERNIQRIQRQAEKVHRQQKICSYKLRRAQFNQRIRGSKGAGSNYSSPAKCR